jgi:hypothetical protein
MNRTVVLVLSSVTLLAACSEDDAQKAEGTGGVGGSGGSGGSGGATGGSAGAAGATGGTAGTGGASGGSAGTGGSAGADAGSDAGLTCTGDAGSQWRDWAANACKPCPASSVSCADFTGSSASYDLKSRKLELVLAPGLTEIVSASLSASWSALGSDGGVLTGTISGLAFAVSKNTLSADLSPQVPAADATTVYGIVVKVTDACGAQSTLQLKPLDAQNADGGTTLNVFCEQ